MDFKSPDEALEYAINLPEAPWQQQPETEDDETVQGAEVSQPAGLSSVPTPSLPQPIIDMEPISKTLRVSNLNRSTTEQEVGKLFSKFGIVRKVTIDRNVFGTPDAVAIVCFAIEPFDTAFGGRQLILDDRVLEAEFIVLEDPLEQEKVKKEEKQKQEQAMDKVTNSPSCNVLVMSLGTRTSPTVYLEKLRVPHLVRLNMNTSHRLFEIEFEHLGVSYKLDFPWSYLVREITLDTASDASASFSFSLRHPPRVWEQSFDPKNARLFWARSVKMYVELPSSTCSASSSVSLLTNGTPDLVNHALNLNMHENQVDIGGWLDYRLELGAKEVASIGFSIIVCNLNKYRLLQYNPVYQRSTSLTVTIKDKRPKYSHNDRARMLDYKLLYMLECAITNRVLSEYTLDMDFYDWLVQLDVAIACRILLWMVSENVARYNPLEAFRSVGSRMKKTLRFLEPTVPPDYCMVSSALVTPTKLLLQPPVMEPKNRFLRQYSQLGDRFLRVTFVEDDLSPLSQTRPSDYTVNRLNRRQDAIYERVNHTLTHGIIIGDRHFEFLAYDTAHLMHHSCLFFASTAAVSVTSLQRQMNDSAGSVTSLAQYVAAADICLRPSQVVSIYPPDQDCQSQQQHEDAEYHHQQPLVEDKQRQRKKKKGGGGRQRPSQAERKQQRQQTKQKKRTVEWIEDSTYLADTVMQTCGKMSPKLAHDLVRPLGLDSVPSAIQYSLGGCLGVLALSNFVTGKTKIQVRPWHFIFDTEADVLEVTQTSSYAPAFLDHTILSVLSSLDVPGQVFISMAQHSLATMNSMMSDPTTATEYLKTFTDKNNNSAIQTMRNMATAGFLTRRDPFLHNSFWVFRTNRLVDIKQNAALHVSKGAQLMVVMDDTDTLAPNEIFCQLSDLHSGSLAKRQRVTGSCMIFKQPCIHSGDIRVMEAVDRSSLRHWYDVIVVSSKLREPAPRQHLDGRIDGQRFTIVWDWNLLPIRQPANPLCNRDSTNQRETNEMTPEKAKSSFVKCLQNDHRNTILRRYLGRIDKLGSRNIDSSCINFSLQYADVIDYVNVPCSVAIDSRLELEEYPDYMEVPNMPSYTSNGAQGIVYRMVEPSTYQNYVDGMIIKNSESISYDPRLKMEGMEPYIIAARELKNEYCYNIKILMRQYGVNTEAELISGYIVDKSRLRIRNGGGHNDLQYRKMRKAVEALRSHYRQVFFDEFTSTTSDSFGNTQKDVVSVLAQKEVKAAAWYYVTYHPTERCSHDGTLMLSFPWLIDELLCNIARRQHGFVDDSPLDRDAIEKTRQRSQEISWFSVDDGNDDSDTDSGGEDDDDDDDDGGDDDDDDKYEHHKEHSNEEDYSNDGDGHERLIPVDARDTWQPQNYQHSRENNDRSGQQDEIDLVPIINIRLSDITR